MILAMLLLIAGAVVTLVGIILSSCAIKAAKEGNFDRLTKAWAVVITGLIILLAGSICGLIDAIYNLVTL